MSPPVHGNDEKRFSPIPAPEARLAALFDAFDRAGVPWCLLRSPESLAAREGDVDVLVERSVLEKVRGILLDQGLRPVPVPGGDLHAADYDPQTDRFIWLHVQTEVRGRAGAVPASSVLATIERDPLPRPTDAWLFWILLLHVLDKTEIAERHRSSLVRLAAAPDIARCPLARLAPAYGLDAAAAVALVTKAEWEQLRLAAASAPRVRRSLIGRLQGTAERAQEAWRRPGLGVAVVGPDGAGKTTLVTALETTLPFETRTIYMGLTGGRLPYADALRVPGLVLAARLGLIGARYAAGLYHRSRGRIVLFDRYTLDGAVPSGAPAGPLGRLSRRVQARVFPTPDLVLFLDASAATMHRRGGEYTEERLGEWRRAYRRLRRSVRSLEVVDAERPADVVRRDAQQRIWRRYADRAVGANPRRSEA